MRAELDRVRAALGRQVGEAGLEAALAGEAGPGPAARVSQLQATVESLQQQLSDRRAGAESVMSEHYFADSETEAKEKEKLVGRDKREKEKERRKGRAMPAGEENEAGQLRKLSREYRGISQAAEVERRRLAELVALLTARLAAAEARAGEADAAVRIERQRCARAERALERANLEAGRAASRAGSGAWPPHTAALPADELQWEVGRLKEELQAVRRELGEARAAREEMARIYNGMMEDARQAFSQSLET